MPTKRACFSLPNSSESRPQNQIGKRNGVQRQDLLRDERERGENHVLATPLHIREVFQGREAMRVLPDQVRCEDRKRNRASDPDPWLDQLAPERGEKHRDDDGESEEQRGVLVQQAETAKSPEQQPESRLSGAGDPDDDEHGRCPDQRFEYVHREEAADPENDRCGGHRQTSEPLRESSSAEFAGDENRDDDQPGASQCGNAAKDWKRATEKKRNPGDDPDEGRVIDIAPRQIAAAVEEVKLVAEVSITIAGREMQEQFQKRDGDQNGGCCRSANPSRQGVSVWLSDRNHPSKIKMLRLLHAGWWRAPTRAVPRHAAGPKP